MLQKKKKFDNHSIRLAYFGGGLELERETYKTKENSFSPLRLVAFRCRKIAIAADINSIPTRGREKMSGAGKKVVDVAFKAGRTIDWDGMAKLLVSDEARREFATLRRAFDEVNTQLQTKFSQEPEPVDWEYYRKGIGSRLVDMYKQAYDEIQIPKYVDNVTPQYKPKFDSLLVELKEAEEKSFKESERLEKEIADVQDLKKRLSTMTADEYFEKHPELKKKFDDEIRNDYWGY
ncbi:ATP synthase subunit d, mitochondrial-like [Salvia miltiorrhiza]|uniref:ATP synthase subunit d, mitochondrial-like n=1 Tax=Salvia miltiorrhiza TaxID=226208 RepID=UPI0025ACF1C0|nr:ATP synthase subunit d, mitochondrial-like [Salvia miltiorrhiza]